jgi:hypothetical protein
VLHPPRADARLLEVDTAAARDEAGVVDVVRDGALLGVLAGNNTAADRALACLAASARWQSRTLWPADERAALAALHEMPARAQIVDERGTRADGAVARTLRARYRKPWLAHASLAPSCALARWNAEATQLELWSHSQGIFNKRRDLALAYGIETDAVRVQHVQGAGCYGHNGADDVAFDAAWLARRAPGRPVRVRWSREDELTRAPFGPAMAIELEADLDARGEVLHWRHQVWSTGHSQRPGRAPTPALLGSWQTERAFAPAPAINMPLAQGGGAERNAVPGYGLPGWRVVNQRIEASLPRGSALRSLGALGNVFAAESFVDEIAALRAEDPLAWRRRHLGHDARAAAVLELAAAHAQWGARAARKREGVGFGLGCARYKNSGAWCAVVAEVEAGAQLRVRRLTIAVDVGLVINPDGVRAQIEGGAVQATSWALKECVTFDGERITSDAWERYPILRFSEVPAVDVHIVPSSAPSLGAGEASLGPTAAAIGNALFDALGVRVRELPLTPGRIVAAMEQPDDGGRPRAARAADSVLQSGAAPADSGGRADWQTGGDHHETEPCEPGLHCRRGAHWAACCPSRRSASSSRGAGCRWRCCSACTWRCCITASSGPRSCAAASCSSSRLRNRLTTHRFRRARFSDEAERLTARDSSHRGPTARTPDGFGFRAGIARRPPAEMHLVQEVVQQPVELQRLLQIHGMAGARHDGQAGAGYHALEQQGRFEAQLVFVAADDQHRHVDRRQRVGEVVEARAAALGAFHRVGRAGCRMLGQLARELMEAARVLAQVLQPRCAVAIGGREVSHAAAADVLRALDALALEAAVHRGMRARANTHQRQG